MAGNSTQIISASLIAAVAVATSGGAVAAQTTSMVAPITQPTVMPTAWPVQWAASANRVGIAYPVYSDNITQAIVEQLHEKLLKDYADTAMFTPVPLNDPLTSEQEISPYDLCRDQHLNAILQPFIDGGSGGGAAAVIVILDLEDCAGEDIYEPYKVKAESNVFLGRSIQREAKDMSFDLMDQLEREFAEYPTAHSGPWKSLMSTGIGLDPADTHYQSLMQFHRTKAGKITIDHVFPAGPASRAGVLVDDEIISVNGTPVADMKESDDVNPLLNVPSYALIVKRAGQTMTLTVTPAKYADLLHEMGRS